MEDPSNPTPLLSTSKSSDSRLQVQLHPLVILTVSDYIARHILREQTGPIVGAVLGTQNGRDITMEHAFECKLEAGVEGNAVIDAGWFHDRLQQFKEVHKSPALDFVGWFTLASPSGPEQHHLAIHQQVLANYNESALLLTFHPSSVADGTSKGGKLPLAIYETVYEAAIEDDKHMQSSGEGPQLLLRFQELPYTIETGEAEMIGVDSVARGAANASSASDASSMTQVPLTTADTKGKSKAVEPEWSAPQANGTADIASDVLSPEDEELISTLTAKANAIRMLQQRIALIKSYLESLPPSYLNAPPPPSADPSALSPVEIQPHPQISHPILRNISSMLARLPLLTSTISPPSSATANGSASTAIPDTLPDMARHTTSYAQESAAERADVALVSLLGSMGATLQRAQDLGRKAQVVESGRSMTAAQKRALAMQQGGFDGLGTPGGGKDMWGRGGRLRGSGRPRGRGGGPGRRPRAWEADEQMAPGAMVEDAPYDTGPFDDEDVMDDITGDPTLQDEAWEEMDDNM